MQEGEGDLLSNEERARLIQETMSSDSEVARAARAKLAQYSMRKGGIARYVNIGARDQKTGKIPKETGTITQEGEHKPDKT